MLADVGWASVVSRTLTACTVRVGQTRLGSLPGSLFTAKGRCAGYEAGPAQPTARLISERRTRLHEKRLPDR